MNSINVASVVFASLFGSALLGVLLRRALPQNHLSPEAKDTVKLAMGLVATMTALVLGLLVASAKGSYDTQRSEVIQMAAKVAYIDRVLTLYGPEAASVRERLPGLVTAVATELWPDSAATHPAAQHAAHLATAGAFYGALQQLSPQDDSQRTLKTQAVQNTTDVGQMRWLLHAQSTSSIARPLLVIVVSWLSFIFLSFGLFAPANPTVITALMVAALSVAGSIFLILELDRPFSGLIQISSEPLRQALEQTQP
jgi:hypothetical protein